ncbi:hypothetical protein AEAC466_17070 [Asticcacaulis sp. AC466]|uniref:acetate/propionate family kinase n=1 Tax=Asticcacaulis sp. AC466 TaxID=1282362 RepID=UPI0003C3C034|nr:hypothetical protein [Asticcacaulis sp. AC466]ESQ82578.1 hypothetical protein AEAC466_17070 [Asticcacaulis sp. AC466]
MNDALLVLNAGSSSLKFRLFAMAPDLPCLVGGKITDIGNRPTFRAQWYSPQTDDKRSTEEIQDLSAYTDMNLAVTYILNWLSYYTKPWDIKACIHRIVHGGSDFDSATELDSQTVDDLSALNSLAPQHQPHNLAAVKAMWTDNPQLRQFACFDTAFHAHHDRLHHEFALPARLRAQGVRRHGFHGLSYGWIAHRLKCDHPHLSKGKVVAAHLGNGASLCAMMNGRSIDTTMGMTVLDGLPMGTRCGAIDPGAVIYMQQNLRMPIEDIADALYNESGLKGLSGISNDMKALLDSDAPRAAFAVDYFALKTAQQIAAMAVSLGGMDGLVFTGGIGENAAPVRDKILNHLAFLAPFETLVIAANEERQMATEVYRNYFQAAVPA